MLAAGVVAFGFAADGHAAALLLDGGGFALLLGKQGGGFLLFGFKSAADGGDLCFHCLALLLQLAALALNRLLAALGSGGFAGLLRQPRRAGQDAFGADIHLYEADALWGDEKFADLVGMLHPARFKDVEAAVALAIELDVAQEQ